MTVEEAERQSYAATCWLHGALNMKRWELTAVTLLPHPTHATLVIAALDYAPMYHDARATHLDFDPPILLGEMLPILQAMPIEGR